MVHAAHVLNVTASIVGGGGDAVHVYGYRPTRDSATGQIVFLSINLNRTSSALLHLPSTVACGSLAVYQLAASGDAASGGDRVLNAPRMSLNRVTLALTANGALPQLAPQQASCAAPVKLDPLSAALVVVMPPHV